jgi:polyhydroxyalkanoate synthesis regulator phasin
MRQEAAMFELFEKAVLTGLGAVSLSQKKAEELLAELQDKYRVSEEEGKQFLDRIQAMAKDGRDKVAEMAEAEVQKVIDRVGLVPRDEFERLQKRVQQLEARLQESGTGDPC